MVVPSESSFLSAALLRSKLVCLLASRLLLAHTCLVLRWLPALLTICADRAIRAVRIFHQQLFHLFSMIIRPKHYSKTWVESLPPVFSPPKSRLNLTSFPVLCFSSDVWTQPFLALELWKHQEHNCLLYSSMYSHRQAHDWLCSRGLAMV